jgi:hypothetical protein
MKNIFKTVRIPALALLFAGISAALLLIGCDTTTGGGDDDDGLLAAVNGAFENVEFQSAPDPSTVPSNIKYFSLSQGVELPASKRNTAEWDIALEHVAGFFYIYTNSGYTATSFGGTGGQGGVWFTDKTDFDDVTLADKVTDFTGENAEYEPYVADVKRYQESMGDVGASSMNIMTYYGYEAGDGLSLITAFKISAGMYTFSEPFFKFNKKAFAAASVAMPPFWWPTNQVYIIRHADGSSFSKFQVNTFFYTVGYKFTVSFRFETLEE